MTKAVRIPVVVAAMLGWAGAAHASVADVVTASPQRLVAAAAIVCVYLCLSALMLMRHAARRSGDTPTPHRAADAAPVLVAYASQTGTAEHLAKSTSRALEGARVPARLVSFSDLDASMLTNARTALFIVSTTGEGDPPDQAARFVRSVMRSPLVAPGLRYGVLALGDKTFTRFCAFGDAVDSWLAERRATRMFEPVRVHNADPALLAAWWERIAALTGEPLAAEHPEAAPLEPWKLVSRSLANPANAEHPAFYVSLRADDGLPAWTAGDIAVIRPRNDPAEVTALLARLGLDGELQLDGPGGRLPLRAHLAQSVLPQSPDELAAFARQSPALLAKSLQPLPTREYSIASLPEDGCVELLVRQMRWPDGRLGLGSGWLTQHAALGSSIDASVRENANFHPPEPQRPMILIGNGTGLAGLRAHLKARAAAGACRTWLIFGERSAEADFFYRDDISRWRWSRLLERVDFAFSRDQAQRIYVQDCIRMRGDGIRSWIGEGAAVYVCGSLRGMSTAVTEALAEIVGQATLDEMIETGRYRRDVY